MSRTVWVIRDGAWVQYERLGECIGCGDCCRFFNYSFQRTTVSIMDPEDSGEGNDISKWEGWAIENWDDGKDWIWWGPMEITPLDEPKCHRFDPETNHCEQFGTEDWKEICRKFPFRAEDLVGIDNCGFSFREVV